jgi:hypothetical protein
LLQRGSKQTQLAATVLLDKKIGECAAWPAATGQFRGQSFVATFHDAGSGARKLVSLP